MRCDILDCMKVLCSLMDMKLMLVNVSFIHCLIALSIMWYDICFILYVNFPLSEDDDDNRQFSVITENYRFRYTKCGVNAGCKQYLARITGIRDGGSSQLWIRSLLPKVVWGIQWHIRTITIITRVLKPFTMMTITSTLNSTNTNVYHMNNFLHIINNNKCNNKLQL